MTVVAATTGPASLLAGRATKRWPETVPDHLSARIPPEARGLARDGVRLLVATPGSVRHARFRDLGRYVRPGDLLVVNTSATRPAAVDAVLSDPTGAARVGRQLTRPRGRPVVAHLAHALDDGTLVVELRRPDATGPVLDAATGQRVGLPGGAELELRAPAAAGPRAAGGVRLWAAVAVAGDPVAAWARHGRPIAYGYLQGRWPLDAYQTVFAEMPGAGDPSTQGCAEMPSAARPFSRRLVTRLAALGVTVAPVTLHCGVSSQEAGEPPMPERFAVPPTTARLANQTRAAGGRVVAVGTTVTRALETVAGQDGHVTAGEGWTDLVLGPERPARAVDGLVTGWHEPASSHLALLQAVAGADLVERAYEAAFAQGYLWHEFGDSCLLLPAG